MAVAAAGAIFLDRDGVINENRDDHVKSWAEFQFLPGAIESIRRLSETGLPIFVVTNQAIVNRNIVTADVVEGIHRQMVAEIEKGGGRIDKVYYSPHDSHENSPMRKPGPGMLLKAQEDFGVDLTRSFIVGDAWTDVQAGLAVGARSILVLTGRGHRQFAQTWQRFPVRFSAACDLADAVDIIFSGLRGDHVDSTPRLRRSFHMALNPQELSVL